MPKIQYEIDWSGGKNTKIESMEQFNELIQKGFEVTAIHYSFKPDHSNVNLLLVKNNEKIIADANSIDEYVIHLVELYDFDRKRPIFVWVPDTSVYWEFEEASSIITPLIIDVQPLLTKQLTTAAPNEIYNSLLQWMNNERYKRYGIMNVSEIFSLVCIIEEKNKIINRKTFGKETMTLEQINKIMAAAKNSDNCVALSFFLLSEKLESQKQFGDALVGVILYNLKTDETLAFNIRSIVSFIRSYGVDEKQGLYDIALYLFKKSINSKILCNSFIPLSLDSPWYTVLPWLCYSALLPLRLDSISRCKASVRNISIPQFFTFGYFTYAGHSFDFKQFSLNQKGHATCILNFVNGIMSLKYIMRFDQSPGQPLVHLDFSYYDQEEFKLISHRPLDFEHVYKFNAKLFIAMMFAGIFDSYFNNLIKKGLKGINELARENPAFLYTLKLVWAIETAISWLNENNQGYIILQKIFNSEELDEQEKELAKKMYIGKYALVAEDEGCNINGLTLFGYIILQRYKRGQTHNQIAAHN